MANPVLSEGRYLGDFLKHEPERDFGRSVLVVPAGTASSALIPLGTVMGVQTPAQAGTAVGAAVAGNTGDGTITASPTVGTTAKIGVYALSCIRVVSNASVFYLEGPDGIKIGEPVSGVAFTGGGLTFTVSLKTSVEYVAGDAFTITVTPKFTGTAVGAAGGGYPQVGSNVGTGTISATPTVGVNARPGQYLAVCNLKATGASQFLVTDPAGATVGTATADVSFSTGAQITFTIATGGTEYEVGDAFNVIVTETSSPMPAKTVPINFSATDGSQNAYGVLLASVTAVADVKAVLIVRGPSIVDPLHLVWPSGATQAQKDLALFQLNARGIKPAEITA